MGLQQLEKNIIMTSFLKEIMDRAKTYLKAKLPVHLTGPAGTGKTTLAVKIAQSWGRPYYFIQGDQTINRQDLIGGLFGYSQKIIEDNFIPTVSKFEQRLTPIWVDNPVAIACRNGGTLIYDEFTRARAATNNVLLGILSEALFITSDHDGKLTLENVHPDFSLILTSNPQEYVGVNKAQNALYDRMITIELSKFDEDTETAITAKQSGLHYDQAQKIVRFVREISSRFRIKHSSVRCSIMMGKVYAICGLNGGQIDQFLRCGCDIIGVNEVTPELLHEVWKAIRTS
ncbi:MAG: AAA family ATPase [Bacillota bacterium]|jgi:gas vesicle protein GvpN